MFHSLKSHISLISALSLAAAMPALSLGTRHYQQSNPNATTGNVVWKTATYVDFNSTSTPARGWITTNLPAPAGLAASNGVKLYYGQLAPVSGSGNQCFEISTTKGAFGNQDAETVNADTRIWYYDPTQSPPNTPVSDDFPGGLYSKVRVWAGPSSNVLYMITPYSSGSNSIDFFVNTTRLNLTTATACQGTGVNFINAVSYPNTYYFVNSR